MGVVCKTPYEKCPKDSWKCDTNNECIPLAFVCDGVDDCADQSDEASQNCEAPIEVRLINGSTPLEGRVEIKYHGTWGTICDDDFNDDAAKVICKSLGYSGLARVRKGAAYGQGDGPIWLDQVFCRGNESSVQECTHWNWGEHNCEHTEDVSVVCSNNNYADDVRSFGTARNVKSEDFDYFPVEKSVFPEKCGLRGDYIFEKGSDVHFRVVQGSQAKRGHYPWQAVLRVKGKAKPLQWCGAVVISYKFVLTAAHCLTGFPKGAFTVVAGDYNTEIEEGTEQEAFIEEHYIHELFRSGNKMNNDIALIKLKGKGFDLNKDVQAICLPEAGRQVKAGMNCTISGFGSTQSGKSGKYLNLFILFILKDLI